MGSLLRTQRRRKFASHTLTTPAAALRTNERWAVDSFSNSTIDGRSVRVASDLEVWNPCTSS